jgi:hypothetical protein
MTPPTPYAEVNAVLDVLLSEAQGILGHHFVGLYLGGSLALGDFNPQRSDIDFVAVTAGELPEEVLAALAAMHARLAASGLAWATLLDGSYIAQPALRRYDPAQARHPHLGTGGGNLNVEQHDSDWIIQGHILRQHGLGLAGPAPHTLIDLILPNELRQATLATLRGWWAPMLRDPARLQSAEYQAFAILTMCRMFYTFHYGAIASKPVAARWAQAALGERWAEVIAQALAWRRGAPLDKLKETLDFIRYTLEGSQEVEIPADDT